MEVSGNNKGYTKDGTLEFMVLRQADSSSASVNEKIKITNSSGELLFHLDGTQSGIGTVGITTTGTTFHVDRATGEITFATMQYSTDCWYCRYINTKRNECRFDRNINSKRWYKNWWRNNSRTKFWYCHILW